MVELPASILDLSTPREGPISYLVVKRFAKP
jgi:hypothetical protein